MTRIDKQEAVVGLTPNQADNLSQLIIDLTVQAELRHEIDEQEAEAILDFISHAEAAIETFYVFHDAPKKKARGLK